MYYLKKEQALPLFNMIHIYIYIYSTFPNHQTALDKLAAQKHKHISTHITFAQSHCLQQISTVTPLPTITQLLFSGSTMCPCIAERSPILSLSQNALGFNPPPPSYCLSSWVAGRRCQQQSTSSAHLRGACEGSVSSSAWWRPRDARLATAVDARSVPT